jgi:flagellar hook-associated protein 1 FlgK
MSIFSVGTGALNAAQVGILTTSHNISNTSTPGYNRQEIVQGTNNALLTGAGYIGGGTHVQTVKRIYDEFLGRQVLSAEASAAEMDSYLSQVQQIDNLLADPDSGLSPALTGFFKGVQEVAANPASIPGRQSMLSAAQSLVARFQGLDQRMSEIRQGLNSQIYSQVQSINTYASQIAEMNQTIINAEAGSLVQRPNDLYDQREQMLRDLNKLVKVTSVKQSDGSFNLFIGKGQPLVIGSQSYSLQAVASNADPERFTIAMAGVGGTAMTLPESQITGGSLGGLLGFRSGSLDDAQNALGRIAVTLGQNFNDQHHLGMDLAGLLGEDFFTVPTPEVRRNSLNQGSGAPSVSIDAATMDKLSGSDYELRYTGSATSGTFTLTRLSDNVKTSLAVPAMPAASLMMVDGLEIDLTGWPSPGDGDSFLILPTRAGARNLNVAITDPRAIAAAAPIRTRTDLANTGTGSIDQGVVLDTSIDPLVSGPFDTFNTNGKLSPTLLIKFDASGATYSIFDKAVYDASPTTASPLVPTITYKAGDEILLPPGATTAAFKVKISGAPAGGDKFTVEGNENGIADNRNAMLLGALQTASKMLNAGGSPTASYQSAYSQIVSGVGTKSAEVKTIGAAQQGLVDQATTSMQQISGVNLDEEAANLLRYQQAYQAAAKILEIANKVFDEVIALGR